MRIGVISAVLVCLVSPEGRADPVARPADSWEQYDLVAKVAVQSIDETREIQTYESAEARTFAHPAEVEIVEPLRMPAGWGGGAPDTRLVPRYTIYRGQRMESRNWTCGLFSTTNALALACHYTRDPKGLVVEWVLPEKTWEMYRQQKETGVVERPRSAQKEEEQQLLDEAQRLKELGREKDEGKIGWEECNRRAEPLRIILNNQFGKPYGGGGRIERRSSCVISWAA